MTVTMFVDMHPWLISLLVLVVLLLAVEMGSWIGLRHRASLDQHGKSNITTSEAALLGLLALLLSFSFSMSASRYDARRAMVIKESNAIGTTYLRARLLPEPHRGEVADLLREYVDVRLDFYEAGIDQQKLRRAYEKSDDLQGRLWNHAVVVAEQDTRAVTTGLFIESLNEVIDMHANRKTAMLNRVPLALSMMLVLVAISAVGFMGYSGGTGGRRNLIATTTMSLLVATVIGLIVDLNRPRQGFIGVSQQSMIELRDSINAKPPGK